MLDTILGGTSSSRLFQEVREKRGLAYSVFSFTSQHARAGQVGVYVGTRPDNVGKALRVVGDELERLLEGGVSDDELERAKDHAKGRIVLALESTSARMSRLGSALLAGLPLLTLDEMIERVDAVTRRGRRRARARAARTRAAQRGGDRRRRGRLPRGSRRRRSGAGGDGVSAPIRVAVAGAAGRMGQAVCAAVEGAPDMELTGRADPALGTSLADVLPRGRRRRRLHDARTPRSRTRSSACAPACTS